MRKSCDVPGETEAGGRLQGNLRPIPHAKHGGSTAATKFLAAGSCLPPKAVVRFGTALMDGKILKPATLDTMWIPTGRAQFGNGEASIGFGVLTIDGQKYIAHSGGQQGTSTDMSCIPGKCFAVAVFAKDEDAEPFDVIRPIWDLYHMPRPHPNK